MEEAYRSNASSFHPVFQVEISISTRTIKMYIFLKNHCPLEANLCLALDVTLAGVILLIVNNSPRRVVCLEGKKNSIRDYGPSHLI